MGTCRASNSKKGKKAKGRCSASNLMKALRRRKKGNTGQFSPSSLQMGGGRVLGLTKRFIVDKNGTVVNVGSSIEERVRKENVQEKQKRSMARLKELAAGRIEKRVENQQQKKGV